MTRILLLFPVEGKSSDDGISWLGARDGNQGLTILAAGFPSVQQIACNTAAPLSEVETTVTAGASSLTYDAASDTYTYIWKTSTAWKNTCVQLTVTLNDGSTPVANFQFR